MPPYQAPESRAVARGLISTHYFAVDEESPTTIVPLPAPSSGDRTVQPPQQIGRYSVQGVLGSGAFGTVYLAIDEMLRRQVAIKVPHLRHVVTVADAAPYLAEAQTLASLDHPHIVPVYDVGSTSDFPFFVVSKLIDGGPLAKFASNRAVPPDQVAAIVSVIADALSYAHARGLVHRDVKPGNILIDRQGVPYLTDFGLAIHADQQHQLIGDISGTPSYMAPEQVRGEADRLDGRTDLWGLGVILYELLTGRRPFLAHSVSELFFEIRHREPIPPRQIVETISVSLERICFKCLAKDIAARYTTGADLAEDLRQAVAPQRKSEVTAKSASPSDKGSLPEFSSRLVGRTAEIAEVAELLSDPTQRLLTITGPGGIGKTRLACEVARRLIGQFEGGCWFADLTEATDANGVARAVALAFGVPLTGNDPPPDAVAHLLQFRKSLLLVLDNFEQVVECATECVLKWRRQAPQLRILVTSRVLLEIAGEREYELLPLTTPQLSVEARPLASEVSGFDGVRLFCDRAKDAMRTFEMDDDNAAAVTRICVELEGLPLAIELAAARVRVLPPAQIAQRLGQRFQLLRSQRRDVSGRQQTLEGTIDWSFDLLNEWERSAFLQASMFRGGFFLEAAEDVIDLSQFDAPPTIDVLQSLREKSLLRAQPTRYGTRFGMYVSLREYGELKRRATVDVTEQSALAQRFTNCMVRYAEFWNALIYTPAAIEALDRLELESENVLTVVAASLSTARHEVAAGALLALGETLSVRGQSDQRVAWFLRVLSQLPDGLAELRVELLTGLAEAFQSVGNWNGASAAADEAVMMAKEHCSGRLLAAALRQQGEMHRLQGDVDGAHEVLDISIRVFRCVNDARGLAAALASQGIVRWVRGNFDAALDCYAEAESIVRPMGDERALAAIARSRGHVLWQRGRYQAALACYAETEAIARKLGDRRTTHLAIGNRANVLSDLGDYAGALACYDEAAAIARELGDRRGVAVNGGNRGIVLHHQGDFEGALRCFAAAEAINRQMANKGGIALNIAHRGDTLAELQQFDAALECLATAESLNREMGHLSAIAHNLAQRGGILLKVNRADEARGLLHESLSLYDQIGAVQTIDRFMLLATLARAEQAAGDRSKAQRAAHQATDLAIDLDVTEDHPNPAVRHALTAVRRTLNATM